MGKDAHEETCAVSAKTPVDRKVEAITVVDPVRLYAALRGTLPGHFRTPSAGKEDPSKKLHAWYIATNSPASPLSSTLVSVRDPPTIPPHAIRLPNLTHAALQSPAGRIYPPPPTAPSSQAPSRSPDTRPMQRGSSHLPAREPRATRSRCSPHERAASGTSTRDFPAADPRPGSSTSSGPDSASHAPGSRARS